MQPLSRAIFYKSADYRHKNGIKQYFLSVIRVLIPAKIPVFSKQAKSSGPPNTGDPLLR